MSPMKCHYEVLGVQRDGSADDFKKAYRKLALKWHPDKNPDNIDECTEQFRVVQQAYDVLSDPQERAWYDKHREAILKGGLGHGDKYEDDNLDVFQYFNSSCYQGFGDDKEGFYAVYDEVFKTVLEEDRQFMEEDEFVSYDFGNSQSVYEEVVKPFYDYWESYCTAKSYVWVEKYDTREAPERRVRRLMEAENKKLRDAARKERNEEIRALAKFVKKRDKRVQEYKKRVEERNEEIARKAREQRERHLQESRKKMENYKEAEWSCASGLENHYRELEAKYAEQFGEDAEFTDSGEDGADVDEQPEELEEEYYDDLFCVACNKAFKSEKAFINHEKSKKHKEMVAIIKAHMDEEEAQHKQAGGGVEDGEEGVQEVEEAEHEQDGGGVKAGEEGVQEEEDLSAEEEEDMENAISQKLSKKQKKNKKKKQQRNIVQDNDIIHLIEEVKPSKTTSDTSVVQDDIPVKSESNDVTMDEDHSLSNHIQKDEPKKDLFCAACKRTMKNEKAFMNHETTKKHKEMVAAMKARVEPEDEDIDNLTESVNGNLKLNDNLKNSNTKRDKRRQRKNKQLTEESDEDTEEDMVNGVNIYDKDDDKTTKDTSAHKDRLNSKELSNRLKGTDEVIDLDADAADTNTMEFTGVGRTDLEDGEIGKTKTSQKKKNNAAPDPNRIQSKCGICGADFSSRSKLFDHIKATGHAMRKDMPDPGAGSQKQEKKIKKKKGK